MKNLIIFLSKYDNFYGSALKIKEEAPFKVEILNVEDMINTNIKVTKNDVIYFLCNHLQQEIIKKINNCAYYIINEKYFLNDTNKINIQKRLAENNILIPQIIEMENLTNKSFPIFCKENQHTGITFQAYNIKTINNFFDKFDKDNFYLEKAINGKRKIATENKFYYIFGKSYGMDNGNKPNIIINKICNQVENAIKGLNVFSIDILKDDFKNYVIDVNPASGFFMSKKGRIAFINFVLNL